MSSPSKFRGLMGERVAATADHKASPKRTPNPIAGPPKTFTLSAAGFRQYTIIAGVVAVVLLVVLLRMLWPPAPLAVQNDSAAPAATAAAPIPTVQPTAAAPAPLVPITAEQAATQAALPVVAPAAAPAADQNAVAAPILTEEPTYTASPLMLIVEDSPERYHEINPEAPAREFGPGGGGGGSWGQP